MNRRPIQFDCHYCLNSVSAWQDQCGHEIPCPHCQTQLIVPSQPIDVNLFDDIFDSLKPLDLVQDSVQDSEQDSEPSGAPALEDSAEQESRNRSTLKQLLDEAKEQGNRQSKSTPEGSKPDSNPAVPATVSALHSQQPHSLSSESSAEAIDGTESTGEERQEELDTVTNPEALSDQRLQIEGLDLDDAEDVISLKCKICESRIHTSAKTLDTEIECPVCFTKLKVTRSRVDKPLGQSNPHARDTRMSYSGANVGPLDQDDAPELKLIPLKMEDEEAVSATSVGQRKPSVAQSDAGAAESERSQDSTTQSTATKPMSRREKYEAAQRRLAEQNSPASRRLKVKKNPVPNIDSDDGDVSSESRSAKRPAVKDRDQSQIEYSLHSLLEMFASPGLRIRAIIVGLMIGLGSALMHQFGQRTLGLNEPSLGDWFMSTLTWAGLGLLPYLIGVGLLWLLCGFVFREAAQGGRQISEWKLNGWTELQSTFLLVGFSFFIAGLPISPIPMMYAFVNPLRLLVAPLLLVAVWYNQNGLAIVGVNAYQNVSRELSQWGQFYQLVIGLALVSFVGGLLLMISWTGLSFITSLLGATLLTFSTLGFSAAAGWHCGWVVQGVRDRS